MVNFKQAHSKNKNEDDAIKEISQQLDAKNARYILLFISSHYDLLKIEKFLNSDFSCPVVACTTSGEFSDLGLYHQSMSALAFYGDKFLFEKYELDDLAQIQEISHEAYKNVVEKVRLNESKFPEEANSFALLFSDGISQKEELIASLLASELGGIPLIGGSAGDDLAFQNTFIYSGGKFRSSAAVCLFVTTLVPFHILKTQHFEPTDCKMVITESRPEERLVLEIDGEPAADAYARLLGVSVEDLTSEKMSKSPLMLKVGDDFFVRSVQKINKDHSIKFYCAVEDGLVLTLGSRNNLISKTEADLAKIAKPQDVDFSLFFECVLRRLEIDELAEDEKNQLRKLYQAYHAVGFNTYGEQVNGLHINQTLTGVVFGKR